MKCPICGAMVMEQEIRCSQCDWNFAEDASVYGVLFDSVQLKEYQSAYQAFRTRYQKSVEHDEDTNTDESTENMSDAAERPWRRVFDWINDYDPEYRAKQEQSRSPLLDDEWAEALTQSVMQMANLEKNRAFREDVVQNFLGPWREELIQEYGVDPEAEIGTYDDLEEDGDTPDPNMPIYQWLNWQVRRPRNLKTVLGPALQVHNQKTGSRKKLIDEICDRIANGTFDNLYIGDYFDVTMPGGEKVRLILAGFDKAEKTHMDAKGNYVEYYAVVVPENCFEKKASMDKSFMGLIGMGYNDVYDYEGSYMYNEVLPGYADKLQRVLNNHILHRTDSKELNLLNHSHLFGDAPYIRCHPRYHGLPLFALHQDMVEAFQGYHGDKTCPYWLSDQMEAGYFRNNEGEMVDEYKKLGVRPYFCIG